MLEEAPPVLEGELPEGNDGLGLGLLGVSGDQVVDAETYARTDLYGRPATESGLRLMKKFGFKPAAGGDEIEVGLHKDGRRTTLGAVAEEVVLVNVGAVVNETSVIVATGGMTSNVNFRRMFDPRLTDVLTVAGEPYSYQDASGELGDRRSAGPAGAPRARARGRGAARSRR